MSQSSELSHRIETVEAGYEYLLAYAAQGRQDDAGSSVRETLEGMYEALGSVGTLAEAAVGESVARDGYDCTAFLETVQHDARIARAAVGLVLSRSAISSLLIDNLNASIHLRALLTDLFLIEQALKRPASG